MHRRAAEVVIVGGGVVGTSVAAHLARAGVTDVVLLEAGELGCGSSGKPLGGVRAQFSDPANVALGRRSLEAYGRFAAEHGTDIGLRRVGYLFLLRTGADVEAFAASTALQNELGVDSRVLTPHEAAARCPYVDPAALAGAAWCADDGYARPSAVVHGYAATARALGVEVRTGSPVVGIDDAGGGRLAVRTADAVVTAPTVVAAAGAWAGRVAAMVGVDLPIVPLRRQIAFTAPLRPPLPPPAGTPFTIDYSTTAYFHPGEGGDLLVGIADPAQPPGFDTAVSTDWHAPLREALAVCAPSLAPLPLERGWAGLYEVTPDRNAVIGEAPPVAGARFLYAAGFSGHGFLQAPAVGEAVRDLHLGREPAVDLTGFDARRFTRAPVRTELNIV